MSDPLNHPELAPVEPIAASKPSTMPLGETPHEERSSQQSSLELALLSNIISSTSKDRTSETRKARLPCFTLPQLPDAAFIGRNSVFDTIDAHLLPKDTRSPGNPQTTPLFALYGIGGIGKTAAAVEYAFSRRQEFGAIFWLEAGSTLQLAFDFGRIASQLTLEKPDETKDLETSIAIAKAWLSRPKSANEEGNESWLLIIDNVDNLDIIAAYIPSNSKGSILAITRDPPLKENPSDDGTGIALESLTTSESAALLRKLITYSEGALNDDERDASVKLANHLHGLPLAITQVAAFIRREHMLIREFVDRYVTNAPYAEKHHISDPLQNHRHRYSLAAAHNFSGLTSNAMKLLISLAFLNADRIQEDLFIHSCLAKDEDDRIWTPSTYESARYELVASSIIKRNIDKEELGTHRIIQAEVRKRLDDGGRHQTFQDAVGLLIGIWPPRHLYGQPGRRRDICEDLLPHVERLYQLYLEYSTAWDPIDMRFPRLLNEAAL